MKNKNKKNSEGALKLNLAHNALHEELLYKENKIIKGVRKVCAPV